MKKSISINIQGIIFNVEEDAYEILRKYIPEFAVHQIAIWIIEFDFKLKITIKYEYD